MEAIPYPLARAFLNGSSMDALKVFVSNSEIVVKKESEE